jgi:hypothetical protein
MSNQDQIRKEFPTVGKFICASGASDKTPLFVTRDWKPGLWSRFNELKEEFVVDSSKEGLRYTYSGRGVCVYMGADFIKFRKELQKYGVAAGMAAELWEHRHHKIIRINKATAWSWFSECPYAIGKDGVVVEARKMRPGSAYLFAVDRTILVYKPSREDCEAFRRLPRFQEKPSLEDLILHS